MLKRNQEFDTTQAIKSTTLTHAFVGGYIMNK